MNNTAVKFCGFTQLQDITNAVNLGADAVGLGFFARMPRSWSRDEAAEPTAKSVGGSQDLSSASSLARRHSAMRAAIESVVTSQV